MTTALIIVFPRFYLFCY